jgi:ribonuclease R
MEVEREVVDLYRAFFLRDRIGDTFDGVISGVTGFGVFVVVDDPFVEGLVRIDALSDDYYTFDEPHARLVGRRSGRVFALGDAVKVEVQSVSVVRRKVDFALAEHAARQRAGGHGHGRGRDRDRDHGRGRGRGERRREGKKPVRAAADKRETRRGGGGERDEHRRAGGGPKRKGKGKRRR